MARERPLIRIVITRKAVFWSIVALLLGSAAYEAVSESLTMTSYYPSPAGIYRRLTTAARTILARDEGEVGIGTTSPQSKLDVAGGVRIGGDAAACSAAKAGTQRYNAAAGQMEFCNGTAWMRAQGRMATGEVCVPYGGAGTGGSVVVDLTAYGFTAGSTPFVMVSVVDTNCTGAGGYAADRVMVSADLITAASFRIIGQTSTFVSGLMDAAPRVRWMAIQP
ncbi:MAG: hypothetical protein WC943_07950 [Elusimicrobiota bacterium]|jgi:hypothetical protein